MDTLRSCVFCSVISVIFLSLFFQFFFVLHYNIIIVYHLSHSLNNTEMTTIIVKSVYSLTHSYFFVL